MPETRMAAKLKATTAVTDLCGTRIYPLALPQKPTYPAITYQLVGTTPCNHSTGTCDVAWARVQVNCYAETYIAAKALNAAVRTALTGWTDDTGDPVVSMTSWHGQYDLPGGPEPGQDEYLPAVASDWYIQYGT